MSEAPAHREVTTGFGADITPDPAADQYGAGT
jgi:hypothetical protein